MTIYDDILHTIGRTPVIRIHRLAPEPVQLYVKAEAFNPMGSVKDRLALGVIEDAERRGELRPGQTVVEATSGNTGIGLAMVCARKGYSLVVTMAENFSVERRRMMRFLGAKVVLTPAAQKGTGMLAKARELAQTHGWFLARQFENESNADMHSRTTAQEILEDFGEIGLDYWVTGFGTGGTLKGVARVLKARSPATKIVVCEPDNSQLLGSGISQSRDTSGQPAGSHPNFRPHLMQGWSPDFIPQLAEDAVAAELIDVVVPVAGTDALRYSRDLAQQEGIFTGISGGATFAGALKVAADAPAGAKILCMLPDTGERYLSTVLFEDIAAEMSEDETAISQSTPLARFDAPPPAPPEGAKPVTVEPTAEARAFVDDVTGDRSAPLVMFALEWCEFCWSVRKMFAAAGIEYRAIDLDSVAYQAGNRGGQIRAVLKERTGWDTIPQIFVAGEFIGGCTDAFDLWKEQALQAKLASAGVIYDKAFARDPYEFLPTWLHPR